eukprot:gene30427-49600_t
MSAHKRYCTGDVRMTVDQCAAHLRSIAGNPGVRGAQFSGGTGTGVCRIVVDSDSTVLPCP